MTKRTLTVIISVILTVTIISIGLGLFFNTPEIEKRNGLTDIYDVNTNGMIAFVYENKGNQEIYIQTDQKQQLALQLETGKTIAHIDFSPNGTKLLYSIIDVDEEESSVHVLDTRSFDTKEIFHDDALITEIAYSPKDDQSFFYLKAMTFENYSPIASARPHDFDVFSFNMKEEKETRYTNLEKYAMHSLQIGENAASVYVQMFDDEDAQDADDIFDAKQRIFRIPLENPEQKEIVSHPERSVDIYDFVLMPNEEKIIFQSISNEAAGETFQYELYEYDSNTGEEDRLTDLQSYAGKPVISPDGDTIYFIVNKQFAKKHPEHHLYKMDSDGENVTEIDVSIKE